MWRGGLVDGRSRRRGGRLGLRRKRSAGVLRNDAKDEDGIAGADFVAVGESGFLDAGAVEESAISAVEIADAATFGVAFESAVDAGHARIVGKGVFGFVGAANAQGLAGG